MYARDYPTVPGKNQRTLLDRIDIQIEVPAVPDKELRSGEIAVSSEEVRGRAERAAEIQRARGYSNARMPARSIRKDWLSMKQANARSKWRCGG